MSNTANMRLLLNEFYIRRFPIMKKSIPPIEKLEELCRRYDGLIPQEQIATIECGSPACANMRRATADLRFWENYITSDMAAYRAAATPNAVSTSKEFSGRLGQDIGPH